MRRLIAWWSDSWFPWEEMGAWSEMLVTSCWSSYTNTRTPAWPLFHGRAWLSGQHIAAACGHPGLMAGADGAWLSQPELSVRTWARRLGGWDSCKVIHRLPLGVRQV